MSKKNKWKSREGVVFSTNSEYSYLDNDVCEEKTKTPQDQSLYIELDKKNRGGKKTTLISPFIETNEELKILAKTLKSKCAVGGAVKGDSIVIQGDHREKVAQMLIDLGYKVKQRGG